MYQARYRFGIRNDGTHNPLMIRVTEQAGEIPGLTSRMPTAPGPGGFTMSLIGTLASVRASASYITGAHNMKFGFQGGFNNPSQTYDYFTRVKDIRTSGGVPNQLTQTIVTENNIKFVRNLLPENFYAQDQWTRNRLTLQGGIRYDYLKSTYPDSRVGGPGYPYAPQEIFYPAGSTPGYGWKDITPRVGAAYDLFGNGKTAVKFNLGKYMEAITATNNDLDMNPLIRTTIQTTRGWTDTEQGLRAELRSRRTPRRTANARPWTIRPSGRAVFNRTFDPGYVTGWGTRAVQLGARAVGPAGSHAARLGERRLFPQLVGQLVRRRQPGDQSSPTTRRSASRRRSIRGCRAAAARSSAACTTSSLTRSGRWTSSRRSSKNFGEQTENWQGVDVNVVARLRIGAHGAGGHEHRAQNRGRLRGAGAVAGARNRPHGSDEQLRHGERHGARGRQHGPRGDEPILPHRRAVHDAVQRARDLYDPQESTCR